MNVPNATELFPSEWLILYYVHLQSEINLELNKKTAPKLFFLNQVDYQNYVLAFIRNHAIQSSTFTSQKAKWGKTTGCYI